MGTSHSSIDSYRDDSRFSSCTTRHPTQNPLRLSGVQRFLALCSEALKSSTVEISRKSRKEDLRNYPKVLKMELLPKERSRRRSMVSTLRQRRNNHRAHYGWESAAVKGLRPLRGAKAPLTLQYPGVQVSIIHPDSEPPMIVREKVGGSIPSVIFQTKCTSVWRCILLGADSGSRINKHFRKR